MRKYFFLIAILVSFQSSFSQDNSNKSNPQIDSLKNILPKLKGTEKVDCLNELTKRFLNLPLGSWKAQADTERPFDLQENKEATRLGYKKGLGYSYLYLETMDCMMFGTYAQMQKRFDSAFFNSAQQNAKNAISIGEELNDNNMLGEAYYVLNWLVGETRNTGKLIYDINYLKKAIGYFEKTDNKLRLARSLEDLYYLSNNSHRFEEGAEAMKKAILLYRESGQWREILASTNLSEMLLIRGEFEDAFDYCKRIIERAEKDRVSTKDYRDFFYGQGFAHMTDLNIAAGDYESALQYIRKGYDYYPTDSFPMAVWASNIGEVYRLMKNYDSALHYLAPFESMQAMNALAGRTMKGKLRLTSLYISMNQYDHALQIINEMLKKADEEIGKKDDAVMIGLKGRFSMNAAMAWSGKKDFQKALKYAKEGLTLLKSVNWKVTMIDNYLVLSDIYSNLGRNDSAYYYLKEYMTLKESLVNRQLIWRLNSYKKQAEEERKTSQINLLNKDNQLKEQKLKQQAIVKNSLIAGILLLFLLGLFVFRNFYLKRKKQQAENERKQTELEMQALRAQMNPHFIFNCLSSINKYILKNEPDTASDYLTRFSRLIRMVLLNSQRSFITLEDELDMLTIYLDMERMRFKNAFNYNIIFANRVDADAIFIPPLLLQPFCENAIWHGLKPLSDHQQTDHEPGRLDIILSMDSKVLNCSITDNGIGRKKAAEIKSKSAEEKKSLGLKITAERLALLNQEKNAFTSYEIEDLKDENGNAVGTKVNLKISYKETIEEIINN